MEPFAFHDLFYESLANFFDSLRIQKDGQENLSAYILLIQISYSASSASSFAGACSRAFMLRLIFFSSALKSTTFASIS